MKELTRKKKEKNEREMDGLGWCPGSGKERETGG